MEFQPTRIIQVLNEHEVAYVLIGGLAAVFHGSPVFTGDADICPKASPDNFAKLAEALKSMNARIFAPAEPAGLAFTCDATFLEQMQILHLATDYGRLDISVTPSGTQGFEDLQRAAASYSIDDIEVPLASLADIIRSKEAAGRLKDQRTLPLLREILDQLDE